MVVGGDKVGVDVHRNLLRYSRLEMFVVTEKLVGVFELLAGLLGVARLGAGVWDVDGMAYMAHGDILVGGAGRKGKSWDGGRGEKEQGLEKHLDMCV